MSLTRFTPTRGGISRWAQEHLRGMQEHLRGMQEVITQRVGLLASLQEQRVPWSSYWFAGSLSMTVLDVLWTLIPVPLELGNRLKRSQLILHVYFCFRLVSKGSALLLLLNVLWSIIPRTRSTWCWKQQWFNVFVKCRTCSLETWVLRLVTVLTFLELFLLPHPFLHGCCVFLLCWNGEICCARNTSPWDRHSARRWTACTLGGGRCATRSGECSDGTSTA